MSQPYQEGDRSAGICPKCRKKVFTTMRTTTDTTVLGSQSEAPCVLLAFCDACDTIVGIPNQSAIQISLTQEGSPMNIGQRMKELIDHLHGNAFEGVDCWACSLDGEQTEYYGMGRDFTPEPESHAYFDQWAFQEDFEELVRDWFKTDDPEIILNIDGFNYIEVYNKTKFKEACDLEELEFEGGDG